MGLLTPVMLRSRLHFCRLRTFGSILLQDSAFCWCNFSTVTADMPRLSFFDQQVKVFLGVITVVTKGRWVAQLLPLSHLLRLPLFSSKKLRQVPILGERFSLFYTCVNSTQRYQIIRSGRQGYFQTSKGCENRKGQCCTAPTSRNEKMLQGCPIQGCPSKDGAQSLTFLHKLLAVWKSCIL